MNQAFDQALARSTPSERLSGLSTRAVHAGEYRDPMTGAFTTPLFANVTYSFNSLEEVESMRAGTIDHDVYSPRGNRTVAALEQKMAALEGTEDSVAFSSGMAAITATLRSLAGDHGHIVASDAIYDNTRAELARLNPDGLPTATFVPIEQLATVEAAIQPNSVAIYCEPVSNPWLKVTDIEGLARIAQNHNLLLVVDNTFLSPAILRPIEWGADLVLHSATKYLSGHGMVQGGVASGRLELMAPIREEMLHRGGQMSPQAAWLILLGIRTLPLRMERHGRNAGGIAEMLASHPVVRSVHYPGLADHPGNGLAARLFGNAANFGGMLSFTLTGGIEANRAFVNALQLCTIATSLGEPATLIWPWNNCDLLRISAGIEDSVDVLLDLERGIAAVGGVTGSPVISPNQHQRG